VPACWELIRKIACLLIIGVLLLGLASALAYHNQLPARWLIILSVGLGIGALVAAAVAYYLLNRPTAVIKYSTDEQKIFSATTQIAVFISIFAAGGVVTTAIACLGVGSTLSETVWALGINLLVSGAAGALGSLFGFIFGIPRTPDATTRAAVATSEGQSGRVVASAAALGTNTNLERVSDWLTTLLIGATLVQLKEVPAWITAVADYVQGGTLTNAKIIPFVAVYYFILGFLGVYLITRLFLTAALMQTLSLHAAGRGVSDVSVLRAKLSGALEEGSPEELSAALGFYGQWPLLAEQKTDSGLNADLARVLAKYLSTGKADDVTRRLGELKAALTAAAIDPAEKDSLRKAFADKSITTGDPNKDGELVKLLA
jgi:hypothetical protein